MTVKIVYIPVILVPNILWPYFDAAFLLKTLKSTAAYSVIDVNIKVKLTILIDILHRHYAVNMCEPSTCVCI